MVDYEKLLESGNIVAPRIRGSYGERRKAVIATTHNNADGGRVSIAIPYSFCKELDLNRGEAFTIVMFPSGKYCLCKVREGLGYKLTASKRENSRTKLHYVYIPRLVTRDKKAVLGYIEDGLIMFDEGSFE